jgi:hypothetical protein
VVTIDGTGLSDGDDGLIGGAGSSGLTIKGLVVTGIPNGIGIHLQESASVECVYSGASFDGTGVTGHNFGVYASGISEPSSKLAVTNSLFSGHTYTGIHVGENWLESEIDGNVIGLNADGTASDGLQFHGVVDRGASTRIGLSTGNVIGGNGKGILVESYASDAHITQNLVGTGRSGSPVPNETGVAVEGSVINAVIGPDNVIAHNTGRGISVSGSSDRAVRISRNSIFDNGGLGIDLWDWSGDEGPHVIDDSDPDDGPNGFQNQPEIAWVETSVPSAGWTTIRYLLRSTPNSDFLIEFYESTAPDHSGHGEGQTYLGQRFVATNANGVHADTWTTSDVVATPGMWITATATRWLSGVYPTSEFSNAVRTEGFSIDATVLLEGPYVDSGTMATGVDYATSLPTSQPYNHDRYNGTLLDYDGADYVEELPPETVDWVLLSLRDTPTTEVPNSRRVGLLRSDGKIMNLDGTIPFLFDEIDRASYYVVVCHINHLCVMSDHELPFDVAPQAHDFTAGTAYTTGPPAQKVLLDGRSGLFAANGFPDISIQALDFNEYSVATIAGESGYHWADFNLDGNVQGLDFNLYLANTLLGASSQVP